MSETLPALSIASLTAVAFTAGLVDALAGQLAGSWTGAHLAVKGGDKLIRPVLLLIVALLIAKVAFDATR